MQASSPESRTRRQTFFEIAFGENEGIVCVAALDRPSKQMDEQFFHYPEQLPKLLDYVDRMCTVRDVYYCPQLLANPKRTKDEVVLCPSVWADLDACPPGLCIVLPSITVETSPNRFQALWLFETPLEPDVAEDISRRIAYFHEKDGADKSGWDLTQLLRIPFTPNFKYGTKMRPGPLVAVTGTDKARHTVEDFADYPPVAEFSHEAIPMPTPEELPQGDADDLLLKYKFEIHPTVWVLYHEQPTKDWSAPLWNLQMLLFESGLSREEVFVIAEAAKCNKYRRDGRDKKFLWKEVCRAWAKHEERTQILLPSTQDVEVPDLLTADERASVEASTTFVEDYIEWAKTVGDAAWQYHQAGAFICLSSVLAGPVRLPTSFGVVIPNLWFMIMADTTLTRKTTAMDMAMELLLDVDSDVILATDGSIEGLMTSLSMRPGKPSVFLRDEFSGLLESITKKDYYAGMAETLTKLYDGKFQKRVLRKEILEVRDPIMIFFAGGIKTRILSMLNYEHIASGFMPRFVFVTAESDVSMLRPLGPPTDRSLGRRDELLEQLVKIHRHYNTPMTITVDGKATTQPARFDAKLTDGAWMLYNRFESDMLKVGLNSPIKEVMTPSMDRLSKSGLKSAVLLAACRKLDDTVVVEEEDMIRAFYYVERWRMHTLQVVQNIGKSQSERQIEQVFTTIKRHPGILRSQVMQYLHLNARDAEAILLTLEQRGMIIRTRSGRSERLNTVEVISV